jgi:hypothetical protein
LILRGATLIDGPGAERLNEKIGKVGHVGGVNYTIKEAVIYDAKQLLRGVVDRVAKEKSKNDN